MNINTSGVESVKQRLATLQPTQRRRSDDSLLQRYNQQKGYIALRAFRFPEWGYL